MVITPQSHQSVPMSKVECWLSIARHPTIPKLSSFKNHFILLRILWERIRQGSAGPFISESYRRVSWAGGLISKMHLHYHAGAPVNGQRAGLSGIPLTVHVAQPFFTWSREITLPTWQLRVPRTNVSRDRKQKLPGLRNWHRESSIIFYWSSSHRVHPDPRAGNTEPHSQWKGCQNSWTSLICHSSLCETLSSLRRILEENDARKMINVEKVNVVFFFPRKPLSPS